MGMYINTNITAMNALMNLTNVSNNVATDIQQLSSGLRINSAADNPAGLIISQSLQSQINGLNQAVANSQDANNLIKTADGALSEVSNLLQTIRQLAVHAANTGVNDQVAVQADQTQITSAVGSIQQIAQNTQFDGKNLLNGTSGISAAITDTKDLAGISIGGEFNNLATQSGTLSLKVTQVATRANVIGTVTYATVNSSMSTASGTTIGNGGTIVINGQSFNITGSDTVQTVLNDINNLSTSTGVSAQFSSANGSGTIVLTQQNYGANFKVVENESNALIAGTAGTSAVGTNALASVTAYALVNGTAQLTTALFTGGVSSTDSGLQLTDANGNSILLTEAALTDANTAFPVPMASITSGNLQFQIGANAGQVVYASLGNVSAANLGTTVIAGQSVATIDVTTAQGAANAMNITDAAIQQVSTLRAQLGAFESDTLNPTIQYLGVGAENLSAAQSQIQDTNVAASVVDMTKNQIIEQAATGVLAQANTEPQLVLKLIP